MAELLLFGYFCSTSCIALMISSIFHSVCICMLLSLSFFALFPSLSRSHTIRRLFFSFFSICIFLLLPEWLLCWRDGFAPNAYRVNVQWTTGEFMKAKWTKIIQYMTTKKIVDDRKKNVFARNVEPTCFRIFFFFISL